MPTLNPEPRAKLNKEQQLLSAFIAEGNVTTLLHNAIFFFIYCVFDLTDCIPIHKASDRCGRMRPIHPGLLL